jgi:radical SAM protein with 4Fe4S-binding SPASM domain
MTKVFKEALTSDSFIDLKTALPLQIPISVMIEPTNHCNYRCSFCPTGNKELLNKVKRPKGYMSFKFFKKIINDILALKNSTNKKIKSILLYKDGEPLLHKEIHKMVAYIKENEAADFVAITSNASLLNSEISKNLVNSGLDDLRISITAANNENYKSISKTNFNLDEIASKVEELYKIKSQKNSNLRITAKIINIGMSEEEKKSFINKFKKISDRVQIDPIMGWSDSKQKNFRLGIKREIKKTPLVCEDPFAKMAINFNGTVSVCCVDWSHNTVVGDLNNESFKEVWQGEKLKKFRILHLEGKRAKIKACRNCDYIKDKEDYANIDSIREKLLNIYRD